jgi:hypothetical protein
MRILPYGELNCSNLDVEWMRDCCCTYFTMLIRRRLRAGAGYPLYE